LNEERPWYEQRFNSLDEAGIAASRLSKELTEQHPNKREYGGALYSFEEDGRIYYSFVDPQVGGPVEQVNGQTRYPGPPISPRDVVGLGRFEGGYHSHPTSGSFSRDIGDGRGDIPGVERSGVPLYLARTGGFWGNKVVVEVRIPTTQRRDGTWRSRTVRLGRF